MSAQGGQISGLLNIDKPKGLTSHDVVGRVRRLSGQRKVGHTGTLDPLATGVLLVCLGQATRLIEYAVPHQKRYRATIRFGLTTDTLDAEGTVLSQTDISNLTESRLREVLPGFKGEIQQVPPIFSALKQGGQPLYKRARAGEAVTVEARTVTIYDLQWLSWQPPDLSLEVTCSAGTYIRALARDIGEAVGSGAHLADLVRTANGEWLLEQAVALAQLESGTGWQKYLYPSDQLVAHLPQIMLEETQAKAVEQGRSLKLNVAGAGLSEGGLLRAYTPTGEFLAILKLVQAHENLWHPQKVFKNR
jgi:tRNA pseudouridine55 synthase